MSSKHTAMIIAAMLPLSALLGLAESTSATPISDLLTTPPNLTTKSTISVKAAYDNNAYLQSVGTLADKASFITGLLLTINSDYTISKSMKAALSYSADYNNYGNATSESSLRHTATAKVTATDGDWSQVFTGGAIVVDGSRENPIYTGPGGSPAIGGVERMTRRAQDIISGGYTATYSHGNLMLRPLFTYKNQNFRSHQRSTTGYQNFADRDEGLYGIDVGWKSSPTLTTFVSYRAGRQAEGNVLDVNNNYTNRISRVLLGMEGAFAPWCKGSILMGEDFRTFGSSAIALTDKNKTKFYSASTLTFTPTKDDSIALTYNRFLQPAFGGRNAYEDISGEVQYRHNIDKEYTVGCGFRDYSGFFEIGNRRDTIFFYNVAVVYKPNTSSSFSLDYQFSNTSTKTRNGIDTSGRTYSRDLLALSYKLAI